MWISILNYNSGQIEVYDVTDCFAENETAADDNEKAVDWLESNGYCSAETVFMLTDECPLCVVNNESVDLSDDGIDIVSTDDIEQNYIIRVKEKDLTKQFINTVRTNPGLIRDKFYIKDNRIYKDRLCKKSMKTFGFDELKIYKVITK
jgi:hypothetical protein